ncbi:MAG: retropepsin-like aspartic protease, partial [Bacteroidota bacterium]
MTEKLLVLVLLALTAVQTQAQQLVGSVPMEFTRNICFIPIRVNDSPDTLYFMFDSGASGTLIDSAAAQRTGIVAYASVRNVGATGETTAGASQGNRIHIGDAEFANVGL